MYLSACICYCKCTLMFCCGIFLSLYSFLGVFVICLNAILFAINIKFDIVTFMSHFNGLEPLKAVLIKGINYRKIDNALYRY